MHHQAQLFNRSGIVKNLVAVMVVSLTVVTAQADLIIDSFDTGQFVSVTGTPSGFKSATDTIAAAEALGGERDIYLERTSANSGSVSADVDTSLPGALTYSSGSSTTGNAIIVWDGSDSDATSLDATGLGGVDLTLGGTLNALAIRTTSDLGASLVLTIYKDAANYSAFTQAVPADGTFTLQDFVIPFASFGVVGGTGADFTNVGAISLKVVGTTANVDLAVDFIKAVPEPTSGLLVGLATLAAGLVLKRK